MKTGWLIGIISAWVIIGLICGIAENAYLGTDTITKLDILMRPFFATGVIGGLKAFFGTLFSKVFWDTLWDMFWWNYPVVFHGSLNIFRYIFFIPLSIGVIFSIALATIRGTSSG